MITVFFKFKIKTSTVVFSSLKNLSQRKAIIKSTKGVLARESLYDTLLNNLDLEVISAHSKHPKD